MIITHWFVCGTLFGEILWQVFWQVLVVLLWRVFKSKTGQKFYPALSGRGRGAFFLSFFCFMWSLTT
jgi:hypothetical protein